MFASHDGYVLLWGSGAVCSEYQLQWSKWGSLPLSRLWIFQKQDAGCDGSLAGFFLCSYDIFIRVYGNGSWTCWSDYHRYAFPSSVWWFTLTSLFCPCWKTHCLWLLSEHTNTASLTWAVCKVHVPRNRADKGALFSLILIYPKAPLYYIRLFLGTLNSLALAIPSPYKYML